MRRFLPKLSAGKKLALIVLALLLLLPTFLYVQDWPTLTPGATLRRMERQTLFGPGELVGQGAFSYENATDVFPTGNYWMVSRNDAGEYGVAILDRFWGVLWRPARWQVDFFVSGRRPFQAGTLEAFDLGSETFFSDQSVHSFEDVFLIVSTDPDITRVEVVGGSVPQEAQSSPAAYLLAHGVTTECTPSGPNLWRGQVSYPMERSAPWRILRGYNDAGDLIYEQLPDPR